MRLDWLQVKQLDEEVHILQVLEAVSRYAFPKQERQEEALLEAQVLQGA